MPNLAHKVHKNKSPAQCTQCGTPMYTLDLPELPFQSVIYKHGIAHRHAHECKQICTLTRQHGLYKVYDFIATNESKMS